MFSTDMVSVEGEEVLGGKKRSSVLAMLELWTIQAEMSVGDVGLNGWEEFWNIKVDLGVIGTEVILKHFMRSLRGKV